MCRRGTLVSALLLAVLLIANQTQTQAQDTTVVQTFTWESDTRNAVFDFDIDPNKTYRQILMTYNMRCHDNDVGNGNVGCREWDYSCNTFITDSSRTDSLMRQHPSHLISGFNGEKFEYTTQPAFEYTEYSRIKTRGGTGTALDTFEVLIGDEEVTGWQEDQIRYQFIITADELVAAGMQAGPIRGLDLPFQIGDFMSMSFRVSLGHYSGASILPDEPRLEGLTEVYFDRLEVNTPGMHQMLFHEDFIWDGQRNLLVEMAYNDKITPTPETLKGVTSAGQSIISNKEDHVFTLNSSQYVDVSSTDIDEVNNEVTVMGWFYGSPEELPANTYAVEAVDANNNRQFNVHLPWSDGNVYFDCGNDGSGYDRINKLANPEDFSGQWNHWAFTKNATTGRMEMYLNGELWHSGTGKTKAMSFEKMFIGKGVQSNNGYFGKINEFSVWRRALSQADILQAMKFEITANHPAYNHLLVYFPFEEGMGQRVRNGQNALYSEIVGVGHWQKLRGEELFLNFKQTMERPALSLLQGDLTRDTQVETYRDSMIAPMTWVRPFEVANNDLVEKTSEYYWRSGYYPVVNKAGDVIDSVFFDTEGSIDVSALTYYDKRPAKYEILSLVTPYGNGLSLGNAGKTFTFDVTDFAPLLQGQKRLSIEMGGQFQEELDIKFHFIEGVPEREVIDIQNVWAFARGNYGAIQADDVFEPRMVMLHPDAQEYKLRSSITGHGQNGEFQPRDHYLNINEGEQDFVFSVWKECSTIPIYPQGGTWPFDRAGWCPGDPTLLFEHDITTFGQPGEMVAIDYGVNGPHMDQANYLVSHQLVSYGAKKFKNNAILKDIVRPSAKVEWERENPSCNTPTVIIENGGSEILSFASIEYGVRGGVKETFNWAGNLAYGESEVVELPIRMENFWEEVVEGRSLIFEANIVSTNRTDDEQPEDNAMTSEVQEVQILKGELQFEFRTNNRGGESSFEIRNDQGEVVYDGSNYGNNETVTFDLDLSPGCYSLDFEDSGDDGLYYWFWELDPSTSRGRGAVGFNRVFNGRNIRFVSFETEFGRYIHYDFVIDGLVGNKDQRVLRHLNIFPNPSPGDFVVDFYSEKSEDLEVDIFTASGQHIAKRQMQSYAGQQLKEQIHIPGASSGMHIIRFTQNDRSITKRVMVER